MWPHMMHHTNTKGISSYIYMLRPVLSYMYCSYHIPW